MATATADLAHFDIDKATGQITLKSGLTFENGNDGEYTIGVRATDPSGEGAGQNMDDILVKVVASNVNEAPGVSGVAELTVNEADSSDDDAFLGLQYRVDADTGLYLLAAGTDDYGAAYDVSDPLVLLASMTDDNLFHREEEDLVDFTTWPEPIGGPDGALFEYSVPAQAQGISRRIHFKAAPDFENPQDANRDNVYEVSLNVVDTAGATGSKSVRITVLNVDEDGKLTLSPDQPHHGSSIVATLTDPDGVESITEWKWASATTTETEFDISTDDNDPITVELIEGATMGTYMPDDDSVVGKFLWAMVEYRDGASVEDDPVTAHDERNDDPASSGDDDIPNTGDTGDVVETRHDSDGMLSKSTSNAVQRDPATTDPSAFPAQTINLEVSESTPSTGYVGMPVLRYDPTKSKGGQDKRVNVGGPDGGLFVLAEDFDNPQDEETEGDFAANGFAVYYDAMLQGLAADPVDADTERDEYDKFGQLALKPVTHLDYESAKNVYTVEVMDEDAANELGVITVVITVTDVNEAPSSPAQHFGPGVPTNTAPEFQDADGDMATSTYRMVAENTAAGLDIGAPVEATDVDSGDTLTYTLGGADAASFAIDSETGQLMTSTALDYETMMEYMVTVTATDSEGETDMIYVTIMVTNEGLDNKYDTDDSGDISRDEVIMAIDDFLFGDGSTTRDDVIAVINLFLFS